MVLAGSLLLGMAAQRRQRAIRLRPGFAIRDTLVSRARSTGTVTGLSGNTLTIGRQGSTVTVNGAPLLTPELDASNGIVHPMAGVPAGPS